MGNWLTASLSRKLLLGLAAILAGASLLFLLLFVWLYSRQLETERATASAQVNYLLQASLENAMLKRDLPGLQAIVYRLGRQDRIHRVMILNPAREVRFSSDRKFLHKTLPPSAVLGCSSCDETAAVPQHLTLFLTDGEKGEVLRSVNPIANRKPCTVCHGPIARKPVNGILIIDYDATGIRRKAILGAAGLAGAGSLVVFLALTAAWLFLRRAVLFPVAEIATTSQALAAGDLAARASVPGQDELSRLAADFNHMADRLAESLRELAAHEAFLQALIDAVPDGIRVIDRDFSLKLVNAAYCRQLGVAPEAAKNEPCYAVHGRDTPCPPTLVTCPLAEAEKGNLPIKLFHRHQRRTGGEFSVEISAAALTLTREGERRHYVVEAIRDLTEQAEISQEQRLSELGQLATGVAHEIHNPLASVRLGLQALMKAAEKTGGVDPTMLAYLKQVDGEVDKCIAVTKRLLDLAMPPSEHVQLVSLSRIIPDVISLLKYEAERNGVIIEMDLPDNLRVLATDSEMRMLVLNMAQNAFHAMPEGGTLVIAGLEDRENVELVFSDTGYGISPDIIDSIFDPFFSRRADKKMGTGLGLTICDAIVKRYGGRIFVKSTPGNGARFTIVFPRAENSTRREQKDRGVP